MAIGTAVTYSTTWAVARGDASITGAASTKPRKNAGHALVRPLLWHSIVMRSGAARSACAGRAVTTSASRATSAIAIAATPRANHRPGNIVIP